MSIKIATDEIKKFLISDEAEVIVLKGKWGTGKTFLWNKILRESRDSNKIALSQYSYLSAFGLNSINLLRDRIFENQISKSLIGMPVNFETFANNISGTFEHLLKKGSKSLFKIFSDMLNKKIFNSKDTLSLSSSVLYMSLSKSIICIDDIERKGKQINQNEILGLVSDLKYQKKCKVVLIFNDAAFTKKDKKLYEELREKVVDREIHFNPTSRECLEILYGNASLDGYKKKISDLCNKLNISNIRILSIIDRLASNLSGLLEKYPEEIFDQSLNSLVLFCYCYYSKDESFPTFDQLRSITYAHTYVSQDEQNQEKWASILQEYGYMNTDDFDLIIYDAVRNGYFNEDELFKRTDVIKNQLEASKSQESFHDSWRLFHDSFQDNKNDVVNSINDAFNQSCQYLSLNDLNSAVSILRSLDESAKADVLIDLYLETKKSDEDYLARAYSEGMFGQKIDLALKQRLENVFNNAKKEKPLYEIFLSIAERDAWSEKDQRIIEQASVEELYKLLKGTSGKDLRKIIKFGFMLNHEKMKQAMLSIREESTLNKLRTDKYFKKE